MPELCRAVDPEAPGLIDQTFEGVGAGWFAIPKVISIGGSEGFMEVVFGWPAMGTGCPDVGAD